MALSDLQGKTSTQLNAMTKATIIATILEGQTTTEIARTATTKGDNKTLVETTRDLGTGAVVGSKETSWSYYATGEVNEIVVVEKDAAAKEMSRRTVKHYKDGRQPMVTASVAPAGK